MKIVSSARKLALRPAAGAPTVSFPEGAVVSNYGANNIAPTVVVMNGTENPPSWQGVSHETGVVLVNQVPEKVANVALDMFEVLGQSNEALELVLQFLTLAGCIDQYTSLNEFVENSLSPAGRMLGSGTGIMKRDNRDLIECWVEEGRIFVNNDGMGGKLIDPQILVETYRNPDGSTIDLSSIPEKVSA